MQRDYCLGLGVCVCMFRIVCSCLYVWDCVFMSALLSACLGLCVYVCMFETSIWVLKKRSTSAWVGGSIRRAENTGCR